MMKLPDELLSLVLGRLPWWKNLQLRGVCKSWCRLLSDPSFLANSSPEPCHRAPCVILKTDEEYTLVNFEMLKSHALPNSSLLPHFPTADCFKLSAATAGLFLLQGKYETLDIFLVNPLNRTWRQLPPVPPLANLSSATRRIKFHPRLMMAVNERTHNVRIIGVQFEYQLQVPRQPLGFFRPGDSVLWCIYVYDMFRNSWELVSKTLQHHIPDVYQTLGNAVFVGDDLYLLTKLGLEHSVLKLVETDLVKVPTEFACKFPNVHIFQHRGHLMLMTAGALWDKCVDIWRLEDLSQEWEKVVSMPENLLTKVYPPPEHGNGTVNFDAEGDFVCFSSFFNTQIIVVYNLVEQVWWEVACKDYVNQDLISHRTFLWQPCLDIVL